MRLDILPQSRDDDWPSLGVDAEKSCKARIKLELERLVVQKKQNRAADIFVT